MTELAKAGQHSYEIRNLATRITRNVPSKSPTAELFALYKWVRDNIRYRYDPLELEWVQAPRVTVEEGAGDCDDMTTLLAALAGSLGHPWRFRTVGATPSAQQHVQLQANDRKRWLNLDPVLEPTQPTTAPRTDPGTFGLYAPGAQHLWNSEGKMLSGPTSKGDRTLWTWIPYFPPPVPPRGGLPPAMPGAFPPIDTRYRSPNAPGFIHAIPIAQHLAHGRAGENYGLLNQGLSGPTTAAERELWTWRPYDPAGLSGPPLMLAFRPGELDFAAPLANALGDIPFSHPNLGAGFLKKLKKVGKVIAAPITIAHKITHGKKSPIRKLEMKLQKVVGKALPFTKPFIQAHNKISGGVYKAMEKAKIIKKGDTLRIPGKIDASTIASIASKSGGGALQAGAKGAAADLLKRGKALAKGIDPKLRTRYPKNARMLWDKGARVYRVYVPTKGLNASAVASLRKRGGKATRLAGLGAIRPTLSFSLGATADQRTQNIKPPASVAAAQKAVAAIETFKKNHQGKPPAIALPAVLAFQKTDGTLNPDGLYGSNTQAAASYYIGRAAPDHAPGLRQPITWTPPYVVLPSATTTPAPTTRPTTAAPVRPAPAPTPTAKPPTTTAPAMKPPSGYVEIGSETTSPGLPPVGYSEPSAAKPPGAAPAPSQVGPVSPVLPYAVATTPAAYLSPDASAQTPAPAAYMPAEPLIPSSAPVIEVDSPLMVDVAPADMAPGSPPPVGPLVPVQADPMPPAHYPPSGTFVQPGGQIVTYGPAMPDTDSSSSGDGDGVLWAAILYLYLRGRKRAA